MEVQVSRSGNSYRQVFERGRPCGPLETLGSSDRTGTRLRFTPDADIFGDFCFDRDSIRERLRELAFLNPRLTIRFDDEVFWGGDGLYDFARWLGRGQRELHAELLVFRGERAGVGVECALLWSAGTRGQTRGFVSQFKVDRGSHVTGLWMAVYRAFADFGPSGCTAYLCRRSARSSAAASTPSFTLRFSILDSTAQRAISSALPKRAAR